MARYRLLIYRILVPGKNISTGQKDQQGITIAFISELVISFIPISVVLFLGMEKRFGKYAPAVVSALEWKGFWIYCFCACVGNDIG